jgi:drug/metabolite transporter (DMT)-like permease
VAPRDVKAAQLGVLVGVVLYSTNAVYGAWAEVGGITFAFWRSLFAIPVLGLVAVAVDRTATFRVRPSRSTVLAGVLLGLSTVLVMTAAKRVPVALIALIGTLTPLLTGLYEAARGERLGRPFYFSGLVAVIGTAYVALSEHDSSADLAGIVLAVGFAAGFAAFLIASRDARRTATPIGFLFWSAVFACLPTTVIAIAAAEPVLPLAGRDLEALLLAVACGGTTGHLLVTGSLRLLPATNAAVIRLTQPFFAMLFAWWIVDQEPTLPQVVGGAVTVVGVAGAAVYRARRGAAPVEPTEPGL